MTNPKYADRPVLSEAEIDRMIEKADQIPNEYFKLRLKALIGVLINFGKRRSEIASLEISDLKIKQGYLYATFTLRKKRKRGLFQYFKFLRKQDDPSLLNKPLPALESEWKEWTLTKAGHRVRKDRRKKRVSVKDKYAVHIINYLQFMKEKYPDVEYLFCSGKAVFGEYYLIPDKHLTGRHLLRLIKQVDAKAWLHLFRETRGARIVEENDSRFIGVYAVMDFLDLEQEETAYHYTRRYGVQTVKPRLAN